MYGNEYKPPKIYLKNGKPAGILVEILELIAHESAHSFNIELSPWNRAYTRASEGEAGIVGISKTAERLKIFDFSNPIFHEEILLVTLQEKTFDFQSLADLKGKKIGMRRGSIYGEAFAQAKRDYLDIVEDSDGHQRLRMLLRGRIDVAIIGPGKAGFDFIISQDPFLDSKKSEFTILKKPLLHDANYLAFPKSLEKHTLIHEFNQLLENPKMQKKIKEIITFHYNN